MTDTEHEDEDEERCIYCDRLEDDCVECESCLDCECEGCLTCDECGWNAPESWRYWVHDDYGNTLCDECEYERARREGTPGQRVRRCSDCGSNDLHLDAIEERYVCDHRAQELIQAKRPVVTAYSIAA